MNLEVLSKCPICYEVIKEPVDFPCSHEICLSCFKKSLETANHWCPICRKRISSWARKNISNPVSLEKKRKIEETLASCDASLLETSLTHDSGRRLCMPGEIRKDYLAEVQKVQEEQLLEESMSEEEARKLQAQEDELVVDRQKEEQRSEATARVMEEEECKRRMDSVHQEECDMELAELLSQDFILREIEIEKQQLERDYKLARKLSESSDDTPSVEKQSVKKSPTEKKSTKKLRKDSKDSHFSKPITCWFHSCKTEA